jgi:hypothetical protein
MEGEMGHLHAALSTAAVMLAPVFLALSASFAQAASVPDKQALEGIDTIAVNASTGAVNPAECGATAALIRNAVVNRVTKAGLRLEEGAPLVANASTATLQLDSKTCVSSVTLRIGLFAFYYTDPDKKEERLGEVALANKSGMLTSEPASHPQKITALVGRLLDEFLLDWREANLVLQMGKLAPAAGDMPPELRIADAQRRLAALGLYDGPVDGILGQGTAQAITNFQKARGLEATGELDDPTFQALQE